MINKELIKVAKDVVYDFEKDINKKSPESYIYEFVANSIYDAIDRDKLMKTEEYGSDYWEIDDFSMFLDYYSSKCEEQACKYSWCSDQNYFWSTVSKLVENVLDRYITSKEEYLLRNK